MAKQQKRLQPSSKKRPKKQKTPLTQSRGAIIVTYRSYRNLKRPIAAEKIGISLRTYSDAERGYPVNDDSLLAICKFYQLDFGLLKYDPRRHPLPKNEFGNPEEANALFRIEKPSFEVLADKKILHQLIASLKSAADALDSWMTMHIRPGSTLLTIRMTYRDIHRVFLAFSRGRFKPFHVSSVMIVQHPPFTDEEVRTMNELLAKMSKEMRDSRHTSRHAGMPPTLPPTNDQHRPNKIDPLN